MKKHITTLYCIVSLICTPLTATEVPDPKIPKTEDRTTKLTHLIVNESLKESLFAYRIDTGNYPTTKEGLLSLLKDPGNEKWRGPYASEDSLFDPWGNALRYRFPSNRGKDRYDIYSHGPDGVESDDDIYNEIKKK